MKGQARDGSVLMGWSFLIMGQKESHTWAGASETVWAFMGIWEMAGTNVCVCGGGELRSKLCVCST